MKNLVLFNTLLYFSTLIGLNGSVNNMSLADGASDNPLKDTQVKVPPFYVDVILSDKAQRKFEIDQETIIVSAYLYGEPKKNSSVPVNEIGAVDLANHQIELTKAGQAQFNNLFISERKISQLASQNYLVNINVFSGRHSSQDNLLNCDFFDNTITKIQPGITLKCRLLDE